MSGTLLAVYIEQVAGEGPLTHPFTPALVFEVLFLSFQLR